MCTVRIELIGILSGFPQQDAQLGNTLPNVSLINHSISSIIEKKCGSLIILTYIVFRNLFAYFHCDQLYLFSLNKALHIHIS